MGAAYRNSTIIILMNYDFNVPLVWKFDKLGNNCRGRGYNFFPARPSACLRWSRSFYRSILSRERARFSDERACATRRVPLRSLIFPRSLQAHTFAHMENERFNMKDVAKNLEVVHEFLGRNDEIKFRKRWQLKVPCYRNVHRKMRVSENMEDVHLRTLSNRKMRCAQMNISGEFRLRIEHLRIQLILPISACTHA